MPVHGTIDLVYRSDQAWRVVDFKTDDVRGRPVEQSASRYLSQLALYREAVKRAVGEDAGSRSGVSAGRKDLDPAGG